MNFNDAKTILNHKNKIQYTEQEVKEIIQLLDLFSEIITKTISKSGTL
jgi:hypothetical protein|tara:strand:+ start:416 stop:559 length:144 start_codon:yes stop_codon:yes gene_type:complete